MNIKFPEFVDWIRKEKGWPTQHEVVDIRLNLYQFDDDRAQAAYEGWKAAHHNDYKVISDRPTMTGLYEVVWEMKGLHNEVHLVSAFVPFCTCHGWAKHQVDIWAKHSKKSSSVLSRAIAWRPIHTQQTLGHGTEEWLREQFGCTREAVA